jgi:hypothetical protein
MSPSSLAHCLDHETPILALELENGGLFIPHVEWMRATASEKSPNGSGSESSRIVENHTDGMTLARVELADAVIQFHLIVPAHSPHRATVHRENCRIALVERQNHRASLHAWPLFGHDKLAPSEVFVR